MIIKEAVNQFATLLANPFGELSDQRAAPE